MVVKRKLKLQTHLYHNIFGILRYVSKKKEVLKMNSENNLSATRTSFFALFGPYSLYLHL